MDKQPYSLVFLNMKGTPLKSTDRATEFRSALLRYLETINGAEKDADDNSSYDLMKLACKELAASNIEYYTADDLVLLGRIVAHDYHGTIGGGTYESLPGLVEKSSIRPEGKERLNEFIDKAKKDARPFGLIEPWFSSASTVNNTLEIDRETINRIVKCLIEISEIDNNRNLVYEKSLEINNIQNFGIVNLSGMLHCAKPDLFPLFLTKSKGTSTLDLYKILNDYTGCTNLNETQQYSDNSKKNTPVYG